MLQGRDVGDSRMNVRPEQGARVDDTEVTDCRCQVDRYVNMSRRRVGRPGEILIESQNNLPKINVQLTNCTSYPILRYKFRNFS